MTKYNQTNPIKVMLVEDSDTFRGITIKLLARYPNIKVIFAASGAEEVKNYNTDYDPDIILLDLDMPEISGFEFLPELQQIFPGTKIVILTLMDGASYQRIARESGADGFITKHQLATNLIPTIYKVVGYSTELDKP